MSVADRLNKLTTDITNAYTSIENKGGTIPANKNTENMSTAINSIEVIEQATAEGESLSLTNTKAMPYSDYVVKGKSEQDGEPSPSYPSEIHSVADDVNLFDKDTNITLNKSFSNTGDIIDLPYIFLQNEYIGVSSSTTYILSTTTDISNVTDTRLVICEYDSNKNFIQRDLGLSVQSYSVTTTATTKYIRISAPNISLDTLSFKKGSTVTPYSPYNQGTVTIKQRGKNLAKITNCNIIESDKTVEVINGIVKIQATSSNFNIDLSGGLITGAWAQNYSQATDYNLTEENLETYIFKVFFNKISGTGTASNRITIFTNQRAIDKYFSPQSTLQYISEIIQLQTNEHIKQIAYWNNGTNTNVDIEFYYQLEEGTQETSYEPYQANDYTFQTEPLRSLPNGVKDTIEADGIHRRVGIKVFDGSENTWVINKTLDNTIWFRNYNAGINSPNVNIICLLSKNFKQEQWWYSIHVNLDEEFMAQSNINDIFFSINKGFLPNDTLEGFKAWLSNNPVTVLYPLAEEIIEPLTQNQATTMLDIIKTGSYEGTTNIYTDEDVKPTIGVGYYKKS